jgi:hypothetical protein
VAHYDAGFAADERDFGVHRIGRLTWRAGVIGVAFSAVFGLALAHRPDSAQQHHQPGEIVIPGQPPLPSTGGSQVTSGAS